MRIALTLNGSGRYIEETGRLFAQYNKLYDDVEFDYYLATWEDRIDYNKLKWITGYERLKEEDSRYFDLNNYTETLGHQPQFMYSLYRVNHLRNQSNIKYDAILQTRSDIFITRDALDSLVDVLRKGLIKDNLMYNPSGVDSKGGYLWCNDYFMFGSPSVMDTYSMAWLNYFLDKSSHFYKNRQELILNHRWSAEFLHQKGIHILSNGSTHRTMLVREPFRFEPKSYHAGAGWHKKNPSTEQLTRLLKEKGEEYIMDIKYDVLVKYFLNTDKGSIENTIIPGHKYNVIDIPEYYATYAKDKDNK